MKAFNKAMLGIAAVLLSFQLHAQTENSVVVSADNMNIFYLGIENPVSVAIPGIPSNKIKVSVNNGTITGSNGKYIVTVKNGMDAIIEITAEIKPGEIKKVGSRSFRVKRIPEPKPLIGYADNAGLFISKEDLLKNPEVNISLDLPFELKFEVISFSLSYVLNNVVIKESTTGNKFSQKMIDAIHQLENGSKIFIEDIKAKGPDGIRYLTSITVKLTEKG